MKTEILQRNPYHGIRATEHRPLQNPTLQDLHNEYDGLLRAEYWIPRKAEDEAAIQAYKNELAMSGRTIEDDILAQSEGAGYILMENRFPYDVQDARHFVLWILDENALGDADQHLRDFLDAKSIQPDQMVCYENNVAYQSASGITHFHIYLPEL